MHPFELGDLSHLRHKTIGSLVERIDVLAKEAELQFRNLEVIESLEFHIGLRIVLAQTRLVISQEVQRGLLRSGVDDELGVVSSCHLRCIAGLEARRGTADERRYASDTRIVFDGCIHRVCDEAGICQPLPVRKEDFNSELVAVAEGEETNLQRRNNEHRNEDTGQPKTYRPIGTTECPGKDTVVELLDAVCQALALLPTVGHTYDFHTEERDDGHSDKQRDHQVDGDGPREIADGIEESTLEREQERIEERTDTDGSQRHRHKILFYGMDGSLDGRLALAHVFEIAIDDDNAVVHNHSEHHDKSGQGDNIQRNAGEIHDGHADEGAQRDGDGGHDGRAQGKQHHHHKNDDGHGQQQVAQEIMDATTHDLRQVGNPCERDIVGQFAETEIIEHPIHLIAIGHDVVSLAHLKGEEHTRMVVLQDVALAEVIFAAHRGDIADSHHLARGRVAEDDLVGHFLLAVLRGFDVDECLLVIVDDGPCQRG